MALHSNNGGTVGAGTTSLTPGYPTSISAGNLLVLVVVNKYPSNGPTTPSGWTAASGYQASGGSGSSGVDTGNVYCSVFTKVADGTETGTVTVTITSANSGYSKIFRYSADSTVISVAAVVNGSDNTAGTDWSITTGSVTIQANDMVIACSGVNTDAYSFSAEAFSQSGTTFGTINEFFENGTNQGDDCGMNVTDVLVSSGGGSGALTYTMTASGSAANAPAGATVVVVLREQFNASATSAIKKTTAAVAADETFSATASSPVNKTVAALEASETFSAAATSPVKKTTAALAASETFSAAASSPIQKTTAALSGSETFPSAASSSIKATVAALAASETFSAAASSPIKKTVAALALTHTSPIPPPVDKVTVTGRTARSGRLTRAQRGRGNRRVTLIHQPQPEPYKPKKPDQRP